MNADDLRERYARQSACSHPFLTVERVEQAQRDARRFADADRTYLTCPDCGMAGDADFNGNDEPVLLDEPKGAGASLPW